MTISKQGGLRTAAVLMAAAFAGQAIFGSTFYWKLDAQTWGDPNDPANWDVGSAGGGNPSSLVPTSSDKIYIGDYLFDLNGGSFSAGEIRYVNWDPVTTMQVTNGTFTLSRMITRAVHMDIWDDATVRFPVGSTWIRGDGMGNNRFCEDVVHSGGRVEILGDVTAWHCNLTVEPGGYLLLNPSKIKLASSWFTSKFTNKGTCEMPNGIPGGAGGSTSGTTGTFEFIQENGVWTIGGSFVWYDRSTSTDSYREGICKVTLKGGRVEATGNVAFPYVDDCTVEAGSSVTIDVASNASFDISGFTFGSGASVQTTGAGTVFVSTPIPSGLTIQSGFVGLRSAITDASITGIAGIVGGICLGAKGNRLDSFSDYRSYDWTFAESAFEYGDTVLSSSNAELRRYVLERLIANMPASPKIIVQEVGEDIIAYPNAYSYNITVDEGNTNYLDSATVTVKYGIEVVQSNVQFSGLALQPNSMFNKYGGGTLKSSASLADFTGSINVYEGVLSVDGVNQLGTQAEGGNAPSVRVYDGATLALEATSATAAANSIVWRNAFRFVGAGHNGLGALLLNGNSHRSIFEKGSTVTFDGDTLIGSTCSSSYDLVGDGFDMNGHTITFRNLLGTNSGRMTFTFGSPTFNHPGNMVADNIHLSMQSQRGTWKGSAENVLTLTNTAMLSFYSTSAACQWTLVCHEGSFIGPGGRDDAYSDAGNTNLNLWCGPVRLEGNIEVSNYGARKGFTFFGPVSGPGGITARGSWVQLVNPNNSFEGGVAAEIRSGGVNGIAVYSNGALPGKARLLGAELRLMEPSETYSIQELEMARDAGVDPVLNVNSAAGCTVGDLTGFGVVSNGGVSVSGKFTMPRAGLESGKRLVVDGVFAFTATARSAVDDLTHLVRDEYLPVHASGGVQFDGARNPESPLAIATRWHFLPVGMNDIALRFASGTTFVVR